MPVMRGSRYFAQAMHAYNVSHVFLVPTILTNALAEMEELNITRVTTHGEKAAAYMADGYARASHRPGICMAQTIGATNLAAGLRDPYHACSPVIAITGGRKPESKYKHVYQEIDDFRLFDPLTKFNAQIDSVRRLPDLLRQAFRSATTGCPGPVHLEFAGHFGQTVDEQEADLDLLFEPAFSCYPAVRPVANPDQLQVAARMLNRAERPVIVAGGGVAASVAQAEVIELAEMLGIPVATSLNGKGTIAETHRLSLGVVGAYPRKCANTIVSEADLVFYIGSRTGSQVTDSWRVPPKGTPVMQLDIAAEELGRHYPNAASLCGDAKVTLRQLIAQLEPREPNQSWVDHAAQVVRSWQSEVDSDRRSESMPMRPERICREVQAALPVDAILVSDTGHASFWTGAHTDMQSGQCYMRACGSLGWALPAALGAKCAQPRRPVVCFTGDGGFYYHLAELETAARYGINAVIVVNNNHSLNQEKEIFREAYGGRQNSGLEMWQFKELNLAEVARTLGCYAERVARPGEIRPALERALACGGPAVVDVPSDIEALAPV